MSNKKYIAINRQSLLLILPVGSKHHHIEFRAGFGVTNHGYYLTDDPVIQEALEGDKRFGKSYRLDSVDNMPLPEWKARQELKAKKDAEEEAAKKLAEEEAKKAAVTPPAGEPLKIIEPIAPIIPEATLDVTPTVNTPVTEPEVVEPTTETVGETATETVTEETPKALTVKEFKLVQDAKDFLNKEFQVPYHEITSWSKVIEKAKEFGFDIKNV